jgi:hypothetical protein
MEWERVLPYFAGLLAPGGWLAILENGQLANPWDGDLLPIIRRHSVYGQNFTSVDLIAELMRRNLFRVHGTVRTDPILFTQSIDEYVESFHGRASLAPERMALGRAAFDAEVRELMSAFTQDTVALQLVTEITWGKPLDPAARETSDE